MKKTTMLAVISVVFASGCSKDDVPQEIDLQINEVAHGISRPDRQWTGKVDSLFADIEALTDTQQKIICFRRLADKVLEIDVSVPDIKEPCNTAGAVISLCGDRIISRMQMSGGTIEDAWHVLISLFSWMRTQTDKLYGDGNLPEGLKRHKNGGLIVLDLEADRKYTKRKEAYIWISGSYDNRLTTAEKRFPDRNDGKIDEKKIPALKEKIEKFLGRPMRTREQCEKDWYAGKFTELREWPGRSSAVKPAPKKGLDVDVDVELPEDTAKESK